MINVLVVDDDVQVAQIKAAYIAKVTGFRVTCLAHTAAEAHAARDIATAQAAVWQGAMHYLVKPFTFAGLRSKLEGYAAQHRTFEGGGQAEQSEVDRTFGALARHGRPCRAPQGAFPCPTADRVRSVLRSADAPLSAQSVTLQAGLSRQAAQRYLKFLERADQVRLTLRYGETGRPEHHCEWEPCLRPLFPPVNPSVMATKALNRTDARVRWSPNTDYRPGSRRFAAPHSSWLTRRTALSRPSHPFTERSLLHSPVDSARQRWA